MDNLPLMANRRRCTCHICGKEGARIHRVSRSYGSGDSLAQHFQFRWVGAYNLTCD